MLSDGSSIACAFEDLDITVTRGGLASSANF